MTGRRRAAAVATVAAAVTSLLGLAACSDDGTSDPVDALAEAIAADPRTDEQRAADQAAADAAVLTIADLPAGWAAEPPEDDDDEDDEAEAEAELEAQMAECLGVDISVFGETVVSAESDTFTLDDAEVSETVNVEADVATATEQMAIASGAAARDCFEQAFQDVMQQLVEDPPEGEELPPGVELGDVAVEELAVPAVGDEAVGFRLRLGMSAQGVDVELFLDVVVVRVGRSGASLLFNAVFAPVDAALQAQLVTTAASRLPAG